MAVLTELRKSNNVKIDPREEAAYKAFYSARADEIDKKIQLGNEFLQKYPKSPLAEAVDAGLVTAYYDKQDWKNFYAAADHALALKPDDVDVLTTVGWVIPHFFNPNDPDADTRLDKAETFEKHAIQVMEKMPKPDYLTESQFAALKAQKSVQAHSALGLVYFRREDYENSAQELLQATQNNASPDQTDLFVLGASLDNLNRYAEAAEAFDRCSQMNGALQDQCKQNAAGAKKQAAQSKPK
jgi:tetratricopeptide (TPR) repeat protein